MFNRILALLGLASGIACAASAPRHNTAIQAGRSIPVVFEVNAGQIPSTYAYLARTAAYDAAFRERGVEFALKDPAGGLASTVALEFLGAEPSRPAAEAPAASRVNYLRGSSERKWIHDVRTYARLQYRRIYPDIDLLFYGSERQLEYDILVAPHADPSRIALKFDGADVVRVNAGGDLIVSAGGRELVQKRPVAYQQRDGRQTPVDVSYAIGTDRVVTMRVGPYDRTRPLTIDPMIVLSRRFGGSGSDFQPRVVAKGGSLYLAGETCSIDFPTLHPVQPSHSGTNCDGFITKMTGDGQSLVYSTYFGGSNTDYITGLTVDGSGAVYVAGYTSSTDFPTTPGAFDRTCGNDGTCRRQSDTTMVAGDGFVSKISADGSRLVYSTYVGGSDREYVATLAVNSAGEALITGQTGSGDYPTTASAVDASKNGFQDAMVTKLAADGSSLIYSTYFGGSSSDDIGIGATFDAAGNAWIVGQTDSADMPVVGAFQPSLGNSFNARMSDAFIIELTPSGALGRSTYFGGDATDWATDVVADVTGVYVTGGTFSTTTPGVSGVRDTNAKGVAAFVAQLATDGSHVIKTQLIDGRSSDVLSAIGIARPSSSLVIHVLGGTESTDFPVSSDAFQKALEPGVDLFYATMSLDTSGAIASPSYATLPGGAGFESFARLATDGVDGAFVVATTGGGFPLVNTDTAISNGQSNIVIVHMLPPNRWTELSPGEVHLYAADATAAGSEWSLVADPSAANGRRAANVDRGAAKVTTPTSNPSSYVEFSFNADAGTPYRLWIRGNAAGNSYSNDSVFAQFSDSVDAAGNPTWRIGSPSATAVILEDCTGCSVHGWGWNDNGYGAGVLGPTVRFASAGRHTLRFQAREDGLSIDQVVLSSAQYLSARPGLAKDDTTVLKRTAAPPPSSGEECVTGEVVMHMTGTTSVNGNWGSTSDATAASGVRIFQPDAGAAKITSAQAAPANYFERSFDADANTDYRLWIRGKAQNDFWGNDSVFAQFNDSVTASAAPIWRIGSTSATEVNLENCSGCGLKGWGWQDNGWGVGVMGPLVRFATSGTHTIRIQTREDGFSIDQIVLSSGKYLTASPGSLKNDSTVLAACANPPLR